MNKRVFIPSKSSDDWKQFLADPEKQWRDGYSAKSTALHWQNSNGLPRDIEGVLSNAGINNSVLLLAIPEWKTPLPGGRRESQTDVFALVKSDIGLIACAVEAKVAEPFGPTVNEWLVNASDGKRQRLEYLKQELGIAGDVGELRYQLFHRTVSAIIEARNFGATTAAMIVQSFHKEALWREDLDAFAAAINMKVGTLSDTKNGDRLLLAWSSPPLP